MNRNRIAAGVAIVFVAGLALAQDGAYHYFNHTPDPTLSERAREFAIENKTLQDESTNMPVGSPPVDRTEKAADPVPKASSVGGEVARFREMDRELQREATSMPVGSPAVDRNESAADALPKATTPVQRATNAAAEERFLEHNSTR